MKNFSGQRQAGRLTIKSEAVVVALVAFIVIPAVNRLIMQDATTFAVFFVVAEVVAAVLVTNLMPHAVHTKRFHIGRLVHVRSGVDIAHAACFIINHWLILLTHSTQTLSTHSEYARKNFGQAGITQAGQASGLS